MEPKKGAGLFFPFLELSAAKKPFTRAWMMRLKCSVVVDGRICGFEP